VFILLVGPKGSGKSHIGRLLEERLGVHFFHVEPLWMAYHAECRASGRESSIAEGISRVHPLIAEALGRHEHVCVETTGASKEILDDLLALDRRSRPLVVRVRAPLELCLLRISCRDPTHQIPMDTETIRLVYELSESLELPPDLTVENEGLADSEIVSLFEAAPTFRRGGRPTPD
jgi:shikimate kinase